MIDCIGRKRRIHNYYYRLKFPVLCRKMELFILLCKMIVMTYLKYYIYEWGLFPRNVMTSFKSVKLLATKTTEEQSHVKRPENLNFAQMKKEDSELS